MIDLNDLRVFERVAALGSFSGAVQAFAMPKSTVSRSVARLEQALGVRLFQRTTRDVTITQAGQALRERIAALLCEIEDTIEQVGSLAGTPKGLLRVSAGIGFGINVLSELLPEFTRQFPQVDVALDLSSRDSELVQERIDVAIRMGPIGDTSLIATRLGRLPRYVCASPCYLERRGRPRSPAELADHDCIEMPGRDGRTRTWVLMRGSERAEVALKPRISVNEALTLHRLARHGAGISVISAYLCGPDIQAGRLVRVLPQWSVPPLEVSILYPSRRELSPTVRAFVDFLRDATPAGAGWQADLATDGAGSG